MNSVSISGHSTLALSRSGYSSRASSHGWTASEGYSGNLVVLPSAMAAHFMSPEPDNDETWRLFNCLNGNDAQMSAEAAGIAVCLIAYNHHACRTECDDDRTLLPPAGYAMQHPEAHAILRIID